MHAAMGRAIPGRRNSGCRGHEVTTAWTCLEVSVAGCTGREVGREIRQGRVWGTDRKHLASHSEES